MAVDDRRTAERDDGTVWTDEDRDYYRRHGITKRDHLQQHDVLTQQIRKHRRWAEFWEALLKDNAKRAVSAVFWFAMLALALGMSGAWEHVAEYLRP